jgi:mRNA-degrading endonuclease RelE of RelBE toxin-antitoxin system
VTRDDDPDELVLTPPARRALTEHLPEPVACAVIEFPTTVIGRDPFRVGSPLRGEVAGIFSARRGTYRIVYRVLDEPRDVVVLRIEHRRDAYRPLWARVSRETPETGSHAGRRRQRGSGPSESSSNTFAA